MKVKFPVYLEKGITIHGNEAPFIIEHPSSTFDGYRGCDAEGNLVTYIAGFSGRDLLKLCPLCGEIKECRKFGTRGRHIGAKTNIKRDHKYCKSCNNLLFRHKAQ